jgi:phenylacetate-CoA ligase
MGSTLESAIRGLIAFPYEHDLYGRLEKFEDSALLTSDMLSRYTSSHPVQESITEFGECPRCYFQTSGTSGRAKQIPYSAADLERQIDHEAQSFALAGMKPSDIVLTLASPPPSLSAWATINGSTRLGASVINTSYVDFDTPIGVGESHSATFVFGTPLMLEMIGETCVDGWGSVEAVYPNVRYGILYGDLLPPALERRVKRLWGIDIRFLYGSVEADVIAMSCPEGDDTLHIMDQKIVVELLPENAVRPGSPAPSNTDLIAISEAPEGTRGEVVVSDLYRDHLPLIRYRTGDLVEIATTECPCGRVGSRLRVLGRRANMIDLGGRILHEIDIHQAIERALGTTWDDWSAEIEGNATSDARMSLTVAIPGDPGSVGAQAIYSEVLACGAVPGERPAQEALLVTFAGPRQAQGLIATGDVKAQRLTFT